MELNISGLKYYSFRNNKLLEKGVNYLQNSEKELSKFPQEASALILKHNAETDDKLKQIEALHRQGKLSDYDCKMQKLNAAASDIIYLLGVRNLYSI